MYTVCNKKANRWFHGISAQAGAESSLRIQMDDILSALFRAKGMTRMELLLNYLLTQSYGILEMDLQVLERIS